MIAVFHNVCGQRTTRCPCNCRTCRSPWPADAIDTLRRVLAVRRAKKEG